MSKVIIEFDTDNAAFEDNGASEVQHVLDQIQRHLLNETARTPLRDSNGNSIGRFYCGNENVYVAMRDHD